MARKGAAQMPEKKCVRCEEVKEISKFSPCVKNLNGEILYRNVCRACIGKKARARAKYTVLEAYGFKCSCCGEDDFRFLSIDHINSDGFLHKKEHRGHLYVAVKKEGFPKDKYRLYCYNCNFARAINKGKCPHELKNKETALQEFLLLCKPGVVGYFNTLNRKTLKEISVKGTTSSLAARNLEQAAEEYKQHVGEIFRRNKVIRQAKKFGFTEEQLKQFGVIK